MNLALLYFIRVEWAWSSLNILRETQAIQDWKLLYTEGFLGLPKFVNARIVQVT